MNDLFALLPDLPTPPKRSTEARVREVQEKAERARVRMARAVDERRRAVARAQRTFVAIRNSRRSRP